MQRSHFTGSGNLCRLLLLFSLSFSFYITQAQGNNRQPDNDPGSRKVSIAGTMTLSDVFKVLKKQTGLTVMYSDDVSGINPQEKVNVNFNNQPVEEVLNAVFKDKNMEWRYNDVAVVIRKKPDILSKKNLGDTAILFSSITGKVVDAEGLPIPSATIRLKSKYQGTNTDDNGNFSLEQVPKNSILIISSIGFETREMKASGNSLLVKMNLALNSLDEVAVVSTGYQTLPRERVTGSFAQIDPDLFNRKVSTNALDRITDVTSGLLFTPSSVGNPKKSPINIRGISTINTNMNPLIVVDNFPFDGDINTINPNDILSITVLKDAAAASIWGVRAGNGVIVINTKKGKLNQKINVQLNTNLTLGEKPRIYDVPMMSSSEVVDFQQNLFNSGFYNVYDDQYPSYNLFTALPPVAEVLLAQRRNEITQAEADAEIADFKKKDIRQDIRKYLEQTSINQQYAINFSGGSKTNSFYGSVGFDKNRSNNVGDAGRRLTARFDNTYKPIEPLEINGYVVFANAETVNNNPGFLLPNGNYIAPYSSLVDEKGQPASLPKDLRTAYIDTATYPGLLDWSYKPLDELKNTDKRSKEIEYRLGASIKYTFIKGFDAEVKYQYQSIQANNRFYYSESSYFARNLINRYMNVNNGTIITPIPIGGILDLTESQSSNWNFRAQLNYSHDWTDNSLIAIAGTEIRENNTDINQNRSYGYDKETNTSVPVDYVNQYTYRPDGYTTTIPRIDQLAGSISRYRSYYANAAYTFKGKYNFTASGRVDGSNFYGVKANQRIVPLWSTGLGWQVSHEAFYHIYWLPYLKARLTYGFNGNTNNSATSYPTIQYGINYYTSAVSASLFSPPNPNLRWERVRMLNAGIDFATKSNRLSGSFEYYRKRGLDLISDYLVDPTNGVAKFTGNNAGIKGSGFDLTLNTSNISINNFKWQSNLLLSYATDHVTDYQIEPDNVYQYLSGLTTTLSPQPIKGKPLFYLYSYKWAGLDPDNGTPRVFVDGKETDVNNALIYAKPSDLVFGGSITPKYFGSIRNSFSYKDLTLSFNITYKLNYVFRRPSINYYSLISAWGGHADYSMRWKKPGDELTTNVPAAPETPDLRDLIYSNSDILVEKGDHIRLQDIKLNFNVHRLSQRINLIKNAQIYLYATNIGIIWRANKFHIDPDNIIIPNGKSISLGLTTNF